MLNKTLSEIDGIISRVNTHPDYSGCVAREKYHALREEAAKHSLDMELESGGQLSGAERKRFLKGITGSERLLAEQGVSLYSLSRIGKIIEPDTNPSSGFRNSLAAFGGFYGVDTPAIAYEMRNLIDYLEATPAHPVIRAAQAHLELVRIHPYEDGNGRIARLLQNFCLQQRNYPPAVILAKERGHYIQLMKNVLQDRVKGESSFFDPSLPETEFYRFIADEVLHSAVALEDELKLKRIYNVELTGVSDPRIAGAISNRVRGFGRGPASAGVSVKIKKRNSRSRGTSLRVIGDIGREDLQTILEESRSKYGVRFRIANKFG